MKTQTMTLKDAARALRVKPYRIAYALSVGLVPEPKRRFANRRIFSSDDIEILRTHFAKAERGSHE